MTTPLLATAANVGEDHETEVDHGLPSVLPETCDGQSQDVGSIHSPQHSPAPRGAEVLDLAFEAAPEPGTVPSRTATAETAETVASSDPEDSAESAGPDFGLSLQQCFQRLSDPEDLGSRTPAYVTLKRWSVAGILDRAIHRIPGRRQTYDLNLVRTICIAHGRGAREPAPGRAEPASPVATSTTTAMASAATAASAVVAGVPSREILDLVQEIHGRIDAIETSASNFQAVILDGMRSLTEKVTRAATAAEGLDAVQRSLMLRYDAEGTALRSHIASLKEQLAAAGLMPVNAPSSNKVRFGT